MDRADELKKRWDAANLRLDELRGVPEDHPDVQAALGELDAVEYESGMLQRRNKENP